MLDRNESFPPRAAARRRLLKPALAALALVAVAASLIGFRASQANKPATKDAAAKVFEFAPGDLSQLRREALGRRIPVSGSVRPVLAATVRAKVPGEIARMHVQDGENVRASQTIAVLDTADLRARLDRELAAVTEAKARLDLARKNRRNNEALLEKAFISQNAFDNVVNTVQVAEANLKSAEAQAAIAERALADAEIRAPFAGIVSRRFVNLGDKVAGDAPVAHLVDLSRMELEAQVPVSEIPFVRIGQQVSFRVDGFADRAFNGKVERINPAAEPGSRSIAIFVALPNADGSLKGGMFAHGLLDAAAGTDVDVIPASAVIEEGGQSFVYVLKAGKVERRSLTLGVRNVERGLVEVRDGLEKGVPVIAVKAEGLKAGAQAVVNAGRKS